MIPGVSVTLRAEILPFGVWRQNVVLPLGGPAAESVADPVFPEPTTLANHIITSAPAKLIKP